MLKQDGASLFLPFLPICENLRNLRTISLLLAIVAGLLLTTPATALATDPDWRALVAAGQLVEIKKYDPTILVEMRYATPRNCVGAAIYAADFPCLTRPETAVRLHLAQRYLHDWGYRLKIWDAYRPLSAQAALYKKAYKRGFLANPDDGPGSLHSWGLAVDATMVDLLGRDVSMPSDFDVFAPEAGAFYHGKDAKAGFHLRLLQSAMSLGGFEGLTTEWWHFVARGWAQRAPLAVPGGSPAGTPAARPTDAPDMLSAPRRKPPLPASGQPPAKPLP